MVLLGIVALIGWSDPATAAKTRQAVVFELGGLQLLGDGPSRWELGLGAFDFDNGNPVAAARAEFHYGKRLGFIAPAVGLMVTANGSVFGYTGLTLDLRYRRHWVASLLLAPGAYRRGNGDKDLGSTLQFRSGLSLAYQLTDTARLGLQIAHLSNASLYEENPGEEDLMLVYSIPF